MDQTDFVDTIIGPLPKEWSIAYLGDLVSIQTGYPFSSEYFSHEPVEGFYPVIRIRDIVHGFSNTYYVEQLDNSVVKDYLVGHSDILIGMDGNFHINRWSGFPGLLNQRVARLINFSSSLHKDFAYFVIGPPIKQIENNKHFTTVKHLSIGDIRKLLIPLPPLTEQRAIAQVLNTVRQSIEATERVIAAAKELKRSMMKYLFTNGPVLLSDAEKQELSEYWYGKFRTDWKIKKLKNITSEIRLRNEALMFERKDVLSVSNVDGFTPSDRLLGKDYKKYKIVNYRQFAYNPMRLNVGSIAFKNDQKPGIVSPDYVVFETNHQELHPEYFNQLRFTNLWWSQMMRSGQGSVRIRYYYHHIGEYLIPLPNIHEQKRIAAILDNIDRKIQTETRRKTGLVVFFESLLHYLMTGKVRVR